MAVCHADEANLFNWLPWSCVSKWWLGHWYYSQRRGKWYLVNTVVNRQELAEDYRDAQEGAWVSAWLSACAIECVRAWSSACVIECVRDWVRAIECVRVCVRAQKFVNPQNMCLFLSSYWCWVRWLTLAKLCCTLVKTVNLRCWMTCFQQVRVENVKDAACHIPVVLERVKREYITKTYKITSWSDPTDFLEQVAQRTGKLLKVDSVMLSVVLYPSVHLLFHCLVWSFCCCISPLISPFIY